MPHGIEWLLVVVCALGAGCALVEHYVFASEIFHQLPCSARRTSRLVLFGLAALLAWPEMHDYQEVASGAIQMNHIQEAENALILAEVRYGGPGSEAAMQEAWDNYVRATDEARKSLER